MTTFVGPGFVAGDWSPVSAGESRPRCIRYPQAALEHARRERWRRLSAAARADGSVDRPRAAEPANAVAARLGAARGGRDTLARGGVLVVAAMTMLGGRRCSRAHCCPSGKAPRLCSRAPISSDRAWCI
jgi:hypothetical protein